MNEVAEKAIRERKKFKKWIKFDEKVGFEAGNK